MTNSTDQYFIHFFIVTRRNDRKKINLGFPFAPAFDSCGEAEEFLESLGYRPLAEKLPFHFYKPFKVQGSSGDIYATISVPTDEEGFRKYAGHFSELLPFNFSL